MAFRRAVVHVHEVGARDEAACTKGKAVKERTTNPETQPTAQCFVGAEPWGVLGIALFEFEPRSFL